MLPHDDSINDRSPEGNLAKVSADTVKLWNKYELPFYKAGTLFRGEPQLPGVVSTVYLPPGTTPDTLPQPLPIN